MINNLGTPSSGMQINSGMLQIDIEISATGVMKIKENNLSATPGILGNF